MFNLGRVESLCRAIGLDERVVMETLDDFDTNRSAIVRELTLWPADSAKKPRDVISARGQWRKIQYRLYHRLFLKRFKPNRWSHGAVKGHSPSTNARAHSGNTFAYVTDVFGFFPAISCKRVNKFFLSQTCSYEVARVLTRLCTYEFHLAQGLPTSPILANEIFRPVDRRIAHACRRLNLSYTRFVDDITISGQYDLHASGIHGVVADIVERYGFKLAEEKTDWGRLDGDISITGVRLKKHHLDASKKYVTELERLIADHSSLSANGEFTGPLLTEGEMLGKSYFVCGLNPGRRRSILGKLRAIDWNAILKHGGERGLVHQCIRIEERGKERPDCTVQLVSSARENPFTESAAISDVDESTPPF